jgi:hypothetical protein
MYVAQVVVTGASVMLQRLIVPTLGHICSVLFCGDVCLIRGDVCLAPGKHLSYPSEDRLSLALQT